MLTHCRESDLALFVQMAKTEPPESAMDIGMHVVVPAFIVSEFRTAFEIGCLLFIPFLLIDMVIADPFDAELMDAIRIVEERDESTPLGRLYLKLYDRVAAMEGLQPEDVDMDDPEQADVWKTVQVLLNKVIYTDQFLRH